MPEQTLLGRCLGVIASLPVPDPFDLERFRARLEAHRGKRLLLLPESIATGCSGMWIGTDNADFIFYSRDASPAHQRHIVVHEIGHMAFGHQWLVGGGPELTQALFPGLNPDLVRAFLTRTVNSDEKEREAETFASLLLGRASFQQVLPDLRPGDAEVLQRVAGAFGPARPGVRRTWP